MAVIQEKNGKVAVRKNTKDSFALLPAFHTLYMQRHIWILKKVKHLRTSVSLKLFRSYITKTFDFYIPVFTS